jgi:outer membrane protein
LTSQVVQSDESMISGVGNTQRHSLAPIRSRLGFRLPRGRVTMGKQATLALAMLVFVQSRAWAEQVSNHQTYTLEQVVALALANHPAMRTQKAGEAVSDAQFDEATTRELPKLGVSAELNRSGSNTIPGAFFPNEGFPPIAGPTRGKSLGSGNWQTGISVWGNWDVLSLVRQSAAIDVALALKHQSTAATDARKLEIAYRAADAFIAVLEAQAAEQAATASVQRANVVLTVTRTLVQQNLRPGADAARAEADLASAQTLVVRAEQTVQVKRAQLAVALGDPKLQVDVNAGSLLSPIAANETAPAKNLQQNPDLVVSDATVGVAKQARRVIDVEYLPRVDLVAAIWLRGSGLYGSPAQGLAPDIPNWALGAVVSWSFLDIPTIRARSRVASAKYAEAAARRDEVYLAVQGQLESASAILNGAVRVAEQTPIALATARVAEQQAVARYKTGLAPIVDVADAQRLLTQAEIDDAVARLQVRRALLLLARASGDLGPFLAKARKVGG